jgi:hypothetical protein
MIVDVLLLLLGFAVLAQPDIYRYAAAATFACLSLVYNGISGALDGAWYYIGAALVDLTALWVLAQIKPVPLLAIRLQYLCLASIVLNFIGWAMWFAYLEPALYDTAFIALYLVALYVLLKKDQADELGGFTVCSGLSRIRVGPRSRHRNRNENRGQA